MYFLNILIELGLDGVNTGFLTLNIPGNGPPGSKTFKRGGNPGPAGPQFS